MGLLDDLAGGLLGNVLGGGQNAPAGGANLGGAASAVLQMINEHPGGVAGLESAFQQGGLGNVFSTWVGGGPNAAISGDQIQSVLGGTGLLESFAAKAGISPEIAHTVLAQILPVVINHVTPNGQTPAAGTDLMSMGTSLLQNFLGNKNG